MHYDTLSKTKAQYHQYVAHNYRLLFQQLLLQRSRFSCQHCPAPTVSVDADFSAFILDDLKQELNSWLKPCKADANTLSGPNHSESRCGYADWRAGIRDFIETTVSGNVLKQMQEITQQRNQINCHQCGMCCKLASADAPYEKLREKAKAGDAFAREFTSVFLPYPSEKAAMAVAPDVVQQTLNAVTDNETDRPEQKKVYFYFCPYLSEDNRCSIFGQEKRPSLCATYPESPLSALYKNCAWMPWKQAKFEDTLNAHSLVAICDVLLSAL
ncbi:MAG: YkgJ family cysteine cluster protein [Cyanobacteria bacterium P01_H01_bin.74]